MNGYSSTTQNGWNNRQGGSFESLIERLQNPNLRIQDYPELEGLLQQLIFNPDDPHLADIAALTLERLESEALLSDNPFRQNDPPSGATLSSGDMLETLTMQGGDPIGPETNRLYSNTILVGPPGSGKTTLAKRIVCDVVQRNFLAVAIDKKQELRHMFTVPEMSGKVTVLSVSDLCHAIGQPPPCVSDQEWGATLCDLIAGCYGRMYAQRLLQKLYEEQRLTGTTPSGTYISLAQLISALEHFQPGRGRSEAQYKESMLNTLTAIRTTFGSVFGYVASNYLEKLFSKPGLVVIEVGDLPGEHYIFLVSLLATWVNAGRSKGTLGLWPPVLFCLDDVTSAVDAQLDRNTPSGTSPLTKMTFMCRAQKIGFLLMAHGANSVAQKIMGNMENKIVHRLSGENPYTIKHLLGLTPEQIDRLRVLDRGEAVALFPSVYPLAIYGTFPPFDTPFKMDNAACRASAAKFHSNVTSVKDVGLPVAVASSTNSNQQRVPVTDSTTSAPSLDPGEIRLLSYAGGDVPVSATVLYEQMGVTRSKGVALLKRLESKGLVRTHKFSTGKRGGAKKSLEVTAAGWTELKRRGFSPPQKLTQGSWEHNFAARVLAAYAKRKRPGVKVQYEVSLPGNRIDVVWRYSDGRTVFFNIGISSAEREVKNALKIVRLPVLVGNRFVLVCRDTSFRKKAGTLLKKLEKGGDIRKKVELALVMEFL